MATRDDLHAWVADQLPDQRVADARAALPPLIDDSGHPFDAETVVAEQDITAVHRDVAVLMLGAAAETA